MILLPIKDRYKEVLKVLFSMFSGAICSIITVLLLITILPFIWCDKTAEFFANLLNLEIYDNWED